MKVIEYFEMKPDADPKTIKLTSYAKSAGCAAKIPPGSLDKILSLLPKSDDENLLVGTETSDDAAVYKINEKTAFVHTLDFFPPVVDEPYIFGQIAATNAMSDIYAMGAEVVCALNIVGFPSCLGLGVLEEILKGGADKVKEAGGSIAGGHSINIDNIIYGLSVTGIVDPNKITKNYGAQAGDILILTKKLGTGIINTAIKAGLADNESRDEAVKSMTQLNMYAKKAADNIKIHACTDITGFSLAGHLREMATASNVSIYVDSKTLPIMKGAWDYASMGLVPEGTYRNREFIAKDVAFTSAPQKDACLNSSTLSDIIFDPQTSGGLLFSVSKNDKKALLESLGNNGITGYTIGRVEKKEQKYIYIID